MYAGALLLRRHLRVGVKCISNAHGSRTQGHAAQRSANEVYIASNMAVPRCRRAITCIDVATGAPRAE